MIADRKTRPCTVRTHDPSSPEATSPVSITMTMKHPNTDPMIVARPPVSAVPPTTVAAMALDLPAYLPERIHRSTISAADVRSVAERLLGSGDLIIESAGERGTG